MPGFQVKSWSKILSVLPNKAEVVLFLVGQWKEKQFREKLYNRTLSVTEEEKCWKIDFTAATLVPELKINHEEADTLMVLHAKHTRGKCVIHSLDTEVLVLLFGHAHKLAKCYLQKGKEAKHRIVWISEVADQLGKKVTEGIPKQDACEGLIVLHALTDCYTVSAFTSKGKWRSVQMIVKNQNYTTEDIPKEWSVNEATSRATEEFVCQLYGKKCTSVDLLRYELRCKKAGKVEPEAVPPCHLSLRLHVFRANYKAAIWGEILKQHQC